jgi:hypothetical protein
MITWLYTKDNNTRGRSNMESWVNDSFVDWPKNI